MATLALPLRPLRRTRSALVAGALLLAALGAALIAQVSGDRGIAPVASSTDIEVRGIEVNVTGDSPQDAREKGWREAQRLAWEELGGPEIPDGRLDSLVAAIVVESETVGPRRYVAKLGVVFDRQRAGGLLGGGDGGPAQRSAPMLTLPVLISGGTQTMFEVRNPWQRAWAEYQTGASAIDYVRPSGAGGESLLVTYGQVGRRSRAWWNNILDYFGAADVIVPVARLRRQWPGGPVEGHFTARYGPDNRFLAEFSMTASGEEAVPQMFARALQRFDAIYTRALEQGILRPDPTLQRDRIEITPEIQALLDAARRAEAGEAPGENQVVSEGDTPPGVPETPEPQVVTSFVVQFASPDASAVDATLAAVRGAPGVRGAATSSIAIGGTSVMRVSYAGDLDGLAEALRSRGFQVTQGGNALSISR